MLFNFEIRIEPKILTHPNIPKPLHGVNPRTVKGDTWWDYTRRRVYSANDNCCYACGVHKSEAKYHNWLEAHEYYNVDYKNGIVTLNEIVALCHVCHNFIHSGRLLGEYRVGNIEKEKALDILRHGIRLCRENNLKPFFQAYVTFYFINGFSEKEAIVKAIKSGWYEDETEVDWNKWKMIIDGKEYYSRFKNIEEWKQEYIK